jgi:GNAT superfamily N-acetyltransferase
MGKCRIIGGRWPARVTKISLSCARTLAYRVRVVERVTRDEILPVRHSVLRPGLPVETAFYPEDDGPDVFHLAERDGGAVIACATFFPEPLDGEPAWRFRGMATLPEYRSRGVGGRLLEAGVAEVARRGGTLVWCNGRSGAAAFYRRHGFGIRGDEFDLPPIGPHYRFVRALAPS